MIKHLTKTKRGDAYNKIIASYKNYNIAGFSGLKIVVQTPTSSIIVVKRYLESYFYGLRYYHNNPTSTNAV